MDTLSNFQKYTSVNPSVQKFKPWSELFIEILLAALFSIGFVAWSQTIVEAGGLICVPTTGKTVDFSLSESRFVSSNCQMEFEPRMLIFYPYYILLNFGILLIGHVLWSKIPSVVTKLSTYCSLFQQISKLTPIFPKNSPNSRVLPTFDHNEHIKEKVKMLHERILFMLLEKSTVMKIYIKKCRLMSIICVISIFLTIMWIWLSNFGNTTYKCVLNQKNVAKDMGEFSCDISPCVYIFGVMIFHLFCLLMIFLLSLHATFFTVSFKSNLDVFTSDENYDRFQGLPGIQDFVFCVALLRTNFPDGLYTFHSLKYVLTQCQTPEFNINNSKIPDIKLCIYEDDPDIVKKKERQLNKLHKFDEAVLVVRFMIYELGLREISNQQNKSHLYDCLNYIAKRSNLFNVEFYQKSIREVIVKELIDNRLFYKLFLDMINLLHPCTDYDSNDIIKFPFNKLEQLIFQIRNPNVWGHWISISAFANIAGIKIILIHPGQTHGYLSKFIIDEFIPYNNISNDKVFFMTFLEPHYYHVTESRFDLPEHTLEIRKNFISSSLDRKRLRKQAIDSIGKYHTFNITAIKKPEQSETITPINRRFDVTPITPISSNYKNRNNKFKFQTFNDDSDSNSTDSYNENDRFKVKKLYDDSNNQNQLTSMFKIKKHIQLTIGRMDNFDKFKNFESQNDSSSDSSLSNKP